MTEAAIHCNANRCSPSCTSSGPARSAPGQRARQACIPTGWIQMQRGAFVRRCWSMCNWTRPRRRSSSSGGARETVSPPLAAPVRRARMFRFVFVLFFESCRVVIALCLAGTRDLPEHCWPFLLSTLAYRRRFGLISLRPRGKSQQWPGESCRSVQRQLRQS